MVTKTQMAAPIAFDDELLELALEMKKAGLQWEPVVGCFVWDPQEWIPQPSPFPKRVYFILSIKRFLKIFGDAEQLKRQLVWLPTWYQARQVIRQWQRSDQAGRSNGSKRQTSSPEEEMLQLYGCILHLVRASGRAKNGAHDPAP